MAVDKTRNMEHSGISVSRTKATKTSLALYTFFNGFYLKNKAGLTGNFVRRKISYQRREQLCKLNRPAVQGVDNAIHRKNRYPVDKC